MRDIFLFFNLNKKKKFFKIIRKPVMNFVKYLQMYVIVIKFYCTVKNE